MKELIIKERQWHVSRLFREEWQFFFFREKWQFPLMKGKWFCWYLHMYHLSNVGIAHLNEALDSGRWCCITAFSVDTGYGLQHLPCKKKSTHHTWLSVCIWSLRRSHPAGKAKQLWLGMTNSNKCVHKGVSKSFNVRNLQSKPNCHKIHI